MKAAKRLDQLAARLDEIDDGSELADLTRHALEVGTGLLATLRQVKRATKGVDAPAAEPA